MISYADLSARIKDKNGLVRALNVLDKTITYITVLLYLGLLVYGFVSIKTQGATLFYRSLLIPGVSFVFVSLFRKVISSPRPYEVYNFTPALVKDTKGKSFPSRHVFSIFIVACAFFQVSTPIGIVIMIMGLALAVIRVVGGVHFIKDVVAGALMAIFIGILCFCILGGVFGLIMLPF